ncbi:MAG: 4-hydroxy-tetrahydrodipicolinate reductase [Rhodospirillales bacterium]|nr:4-hydroxy-tetrahydrodipicolinate reductase [Rhodospirillales bacterium]MSP79821.1 4-hydroxy-tetrahydrodipicolinate reductase [Rhodospirillales bacterium]
MKIGITGCAGRMGRMVAVAVAGTEGCVIAAGSEAENSSALGQDIASLAGLPACGARVVADTAAVFRASDAVIDFTTPAAAFAHARLAAETGHALVIGTTGLGPEHERALQEAAKKTVIVRAANFSVGVNVILGLAREAARILRDDYDIEILEMHHRGKVDAPSGTALALGAAVAEGRQVSLALKSAGARDGVTGARKPGDIGFAVMRGGDVIGDHTVVFAGEGERIEIGHRASSRVVFAAGAVRAALWTKGRAPGLYSMRDVLGFTA